MKRIISISLLFLMLFVAGHPTLMFHFCGGGLASVSMLDYQESSCCCDHTSHSKPLTTSISPENKCCNTTHAELSTDDYRTQGDTYQLNLPTFERLVFICNYMFPINPLHETTSTKYKFPPDGLAEQNTDRLVFISVYLI